MARKKVSFAEAAEEWTFEAYLQSGLYNYGEESGIKN